MIIGRIKWFAVDSNARSRVGPLENAIALEDVGIVRRRSTRGHERHMEIFREVMDGVQPTDLRYETVLDRVNLEVKKRLDELKANSDEDWNDEVGPATYMKTVNLDGVFNFGLAEHPEPNRTGFGLTADRRDRRTFSWEWFSVSGPEAAEKLQETGRLRFRTAETSCGNEIVYTRFESDVSLRIKPMSEADKRTIDRWRVHIYEGSEIHWPSLVDGKVVPNGALT